MSRFFVDPSQVEGKSIIINDKDDIHHMIKVLRLEEGDEIQVSDGTYWEYQTLITSINERGIIVEIRDKQSFANEPVLKVTLFQGVPKQGKMETIIQKCVELGVNRIVPVFMERCVVAENNTFEKKRLRWQKVSSEAVKQCKRGIIPEVSGAVGVPEMIEGFEDFDLVLFPYENEKDRTMKDALNDARDDLVNQRMFLSMWGNLEKVAVIIGPEGGFSDAEAQAIIEAGGEAVSLGRTTLRTETAGMAALTMIMYELEL